MIKYRVGVGYNIFDFDNAGEAVDFALAAKLHQVGYYNTVSIDFITEDTVEEDPEDDGDN